MQKTQGDVDQMPRIPSLKIPDTLPTPKAIKSFGDNEHSYDPLFWEFQYEFRRYLSRVDDTRLDDRYRGILRNMKAFISPDRHVIPIRSFLSSWYWYRKEHQTRLEFTIRKRTPPEAPFNIIRTTPHADAPARPRHPNAGDVLFRYGNQIYLKRMLYDGDIRIRSASFYDDAELGSARADNECSKRSFIAGEGTRIIAKDGTQAPVIGDIQREVSSSDYYMLCFSCDWDPELYSEFDDADACLVIHQPKILAQRLERAASNQLHGWYFYDDPIEYFDPYEMSKNQVFDAAICKDFKFAYQREYRYLWMHMQGQNATGYRHLNVGPLHDIVGLYIR